MTRLHPRISINSLCFPGASVTELAAHWQALAARRVSLISPLIDNYGIKSIKQALQHQEAQLETIAHAFGAGQHLSNERGQWAAPRERLLKLIDEAANLGAHSIYMTTGGHGSLRWEQAAEIFAEMIAPCVVAARQTGIGLMIENAMPVYADMHIAHSLRDTLTLAELADIGICIDLFACWMEADLQTHIAQATPRCGLVQVSDYIYGDRTLPARAVPGDGAIPLREILRSFIEAGYTGAFDLELIGPRIDAEGHRKAVARTTKYLSTLLNTLSHCEPEK